MPAIRQEALMGTSVIEDIRNERASVMETFHYYGGVRKNLSYSAIWSLEPKGSCQNLDLIFTFTFSLTVQVSSTK